MAKKASNLTTNQKVKVNFCLPDFGMTKIVTWECHVDKSSEIRYDIIVGRYIITLFLLYIYFVNTSLKEDMDHLKGAQHLWLIWVCTNSTF